MSMRRFFLPSWWSLPPLNITVDESMFQLQCFVCTGHHPFLPHYSTVLATEISVAAAEAARLALKMGSAAMDTITFMAELGEELQVIKPVLK